jgi:hypothetical protein
MVDFKRGAEAEIELLTLELEQMSARKRVVELKLAALRAYLSAEEAGPGIRSRAPLPQRGLNYDGNLGKKSVKEQVVEAALRILSDGIPRSTDVLVEQFVNDGIAVGGTNKATTVSSILSRNKNFKASRKEGWSLDKKESLAANEAFDLQPTP